jgi:hypothetical protein
MEMVKLCSYFLLIKCLGSSAWPERCLGKAKVAGSIPAQGFLFSQKQAHFEEIEDYLINGPTLPNSVRILPKSVRNSVNIPRIDWKAYIQYLGKNFSKHTANTRLSYSKNYFQVLMTVMHQV